MEIIGFDGEAKQGWAHFRCDVCLLAYNTPDCGFTTTAMVCKQGRYTRELIKVCVECVEYIGGDYERM